MGFFGSLFGGGKKTETAAEKKVVSPVTAAAPVATGVQPEVIAAITAGVYAAMADDAEMIAAITAAIKHSGGGVPVVRIKRTNNLWSISGRNDLMSARQACF
ncbi:MAG: hypothetical protein ACRC8T_04815 [Acidaminococcaceae bacterium]